MFDVVVVGGGPAGSAASRLLASWGYRVAMLVGLPSQHPPLAESLPPSVRKPLGALGLLSTIDDSEILRSNGNTVAWAGAALRSTAFGEGGSGLQVRRDQFDSLLQSAAAEAGVYTIHGVARSVRLGDEEGKSFPGEVTWTGRASEGTVRGHWILDCSGRAGVVARRGLRRRHSVPSTLAVSAVWNSPSAWELRDPSHTLVESYPDGWAWSVPVSAAQRHVAVMVDPRKTNFERGEGLERAYRAELEKTVHHRRLLLKDAELVVTPWACTATPYSASGYGGKGFLLVGDAASFIDPLSSFGVKKALASAWLAAVVVNTALKNPQMVGPAISLFEARERIAYDGYSAQAADFYAQAAEYHRHPFWTARARATPEPSDPLGTSPDSESVLRDPRLPAAVEYLRSAPRFQLRLATGVSRERRPVVRGCEVVLEEQLVSPSASGGIGTVRGIDLPQLVDLLGTHERVPDLYEAWVRERAPVEIRDLLGALSVLVAMELVEPIPADP
ncbi:MAG: hypothetical protein GEU90_19600 [Gemmatimonas sp.]|nr:hypothetical protein [Gemmatimonas sp.]